MKKFYTTLVVALLATMGFAQVTPVERQHIPSPVLRVGNSQELLLDLNKAQKKHRTAGAFEYSYHDAINYNTEYQRPFPVAILSDSLVRTGYADGAGGTNWFGVQKYSVGCIYDFTSPDWTEFYRNYEDEDGNLVSVPDFGKTQNFNVDSVGLQFLYQWGSEVNSDVVDTLIVSIAAIEGLPIGPVYSIPSPGDTIWYYTWAEIPWDRLGDAVFTANVPGVTDIKYYKYKHLLTIEDTSLASGSDGILINNLYTPLPDDFKNLTNQKQLVMAYSFKSGSRNPEVSQRYETDTMGKQVNLFRVLYFDDPRPEYSNVEGQEATPALLTDLNIAIEANFLSMHPNALEHNKYVNTAEWLGPLHRPLLSVVASCNDCEWININELEKRNITIRPNPATENFRLDLEGSGAAQVELYNMTGQLMHREQVNDQTVTVNVNNLNSGMYLLRVVQDGKLYTAKVMVK